MERRAAVEARLHQNAILACKLLCIKPHIAEMVRYLVDNLRAVDGVGAVETDFRRCFVAVGGKDERTRIGGMDFGHLIGQLFGIQS